METPGFRIGFDGPPSAWGFPDEGRSDTEIQRQVREPFPAPSGLRLFYQQRPDLKAGRSRPHRLGKCLEGLTDANPARLGLMGGRGAR